MIVPDTIGWAKPEDVGMSRERLARLGDLMAADVARGLVPVAVTLVARGGRIVHFKAHGALAPGRDAPMERDSLFRIYSMTKPVVSVAAMMLAEEGRLTLGDPVSAYIPEFADTTVLAGDGRVPLSWPITVHDLLRHTAGLTYGWMGDGPVERLYVAARIGERAVDNAEHALRVAALPLLRQPGTGWTYSVATDILGRVIEVVAGESLGDHLRRRVFGPLGMNDTGFSVRPGQEGRLAEAFPQDPETGEAVRLLNVVDPPVFESGGGGLVSTAPDYARFLHALAAGGALEGTRLLSPATLAYMTADHLGPKVTDGTGMLPAGYGFGLGFAVRRGAGVAPFPGSAGDHYWEGLGGTSFWIDPAEELYGLVMVQAPGRREHYRRVVRQLVYGAIVERAG